MPVTALHAEVARIALGAAGHGFALGGGNALLAYGLISRPTRDVDLFTDQEHGVQAAAGAVEAALRDAGFAAERRDQAAGLADVFPGLGEGLAEWVVIASDGAQMMLQMAYFDRGCEPVVMDIGAVLDLEDVAGGKVCALAGRVEPRDYADTAAMLERFSPAQLLGFARRLDPGLEGRDFADAGQRLDQLSDRAFAAIGLGREDVAIIRQQFTAWPRTAEAAGRALEAEPPEGAPRGYPQLRADCDEVQEDPITSSSTDASREDPEAGR
jgi:Nucleotidyl transferase AbiEii toxin, Type IV TA system